MHVPVLLDRCVELLAPALDRPDAFMVDATLGLGGHSEKFLATFPDLTLIGVDRDPQALAKAQDRLAQFGERFVPLAGEHEHLAALLETVNGGRVHAVLFDLGVSSMQLDEPERGFSYSREAPLDMRMNPQDELTAAVIVNTYTEQQLVGVLRDFGEEKSARRISRAILAARAIKPITSTTELAELVREAIPAPAKRTGGNPAKRTFQALRIEINREIQGLPAAIDAALGAIVVGGRIAVISYHSLEDRIVKRRFAKDATESSPVRLPVIPDDARPSLRLLTRGAEVPSDLEISENPRAASAKLRAAERVRGVAA
ncbi:MAG: 16S rRNA (cytosine(1402)-N(4))-methyltransferase RsmH [Candidatus Nanopelagicales bacterium]